MDGVVLDWRTLQADTYYGVRNPDNQVLMHEVGHWMGLYHTFDVSRTEIS